MRTADLLLSLNDRVSRAGRGTVDGTVSRIEGDVSLITYDEGGSGWWPIPRTNLLAVGTAVRRLEGRVTVNATVLDDDGFSVHIEYVEGGSGWWPFESLQTR